MYRKMILDYLRKHEDEIVYPSDIAEEYGVSAWEMFNVCKKMVTEGVIKYD